MNKEKSLCGDWLCYKTLKGIKNATFNNISVTNIVDVIEKESIGISNFKYSPSTRSVFSVLSTLYISILSLMTIFDSVPTSWRFQLCLLLRTKLYYRLITTMLGQNVRVQTMQASFKFFTFEYEYVKMYGLHF